MGGYIGARAGSLSTTTVANVQDVTATDTTPEVTIINNTHEDTDGGREGKVIFKGQQSGGEESTLAEIQGSHDGTSDDEKGDLIFRTNDGSDGASPTERMRIDSGGTVNITSPSNARALKMQNGANNSASQITFLSDDGTEDSFIRNQSSTSATDTLSFGTGGTERMRISADGNAGIGDSSPANTLSVIGASTTGSGSTGNVAEFAGPSNTNGFQVFVDDSGNNSGIQTKNGDGFIINPHGGNVGIGATPTTALTVSTDGTEQLTINRADASISTGNTVGTILFTGDDPSANQTGARIQILAAENWSTNAYGSDITFSNDSSGTLTERMRIDSSGNLLVGKTTTSFSTAGSGILATGEGQFVRDGGHPISINRKTNDGNLIYFAKDGSTVGSIGVDNTDNLFLSGNSSHSGIMCGTSEILPYANGSVTDNTEDLGSASFRWDDVFATNGTIQTSDANEKQNIASLTSAEITAATAISKLFKTFKWNDSVAAKGDNARTHTGVIAQQVESAMSDAGLDAGNYAFFISTTWWETQTEVAAVEAVEAQDAVYEDVVIPAVEEVLDEDGNVVTEAQPERTEQRLVTEAVEAVEAKDAYTRTDTYQTADEAPEGATERNRKGIRYPELLSFVGAATEQRLTSIEARLTALEG